MFATHVMAFDSDMLQCLINCCIIIIIIIIIINALYKLMCDSDTNLASQIPSLSIIFFQLLLSALDFHFKFMQLKVTQMHSR